MAKNPTPQEIQKALIEHGVDVKFYKDWDKKGREWSNGLQACVYITHLPPLLERAMGLHPYIEQ